MSDDNKPAAAAPVQSYPQFIEDRPAPTSGQGEVDNAIDLLADLITGEKTPRDVLATVMAKAFSGSADEKAAEAEAERPKLRAVDGTGR